MVKSKYDDHAFEFDVVLPGWEEGFPHQDLLRKRTKGLEKKIGICNKRSLYIFSMNRFYQGDWIIVWHQIY